MSGASLSFMSCTLTKVHIFSQLAAPTWRHALSLGSPHPLCVVFVQGAAAGKGSTGGKKVDPVQQLLAVYEAALTHLQAQGALVNAVKPEYLLPEADFTKLMEDRTAAAAGNPELEEQLDYWAAVEASFGMYSAMAWNTVLLQVRGLVGSGLGFRVEVQKA